MSAGGATLARRLALCAVVLVWLPVLVELLALDPAALLHYREPVAAALRLALTNATPYLASAVSCALLALLARRCPLDLAAHSRSSTLRWAVLALLVGGGAAFAARSIAEVLLAGDARVDHGRLRLGGAGPLAPSLPLEPLEFESVGELATRQLPERDETWEAQVRWVAMRSAATDPGHEAARMELVAGGSVRDVTSDFALLQPGEARVVTRAVRVGPGPAEVRLRLACESEPPVVFLDATRALDWHGMALEAGAGDRAYHVTTPAAPGAPQLPAFSVAGQHVAGGHTVVVLSGSEWQRHDLTRLLAQDAAIELQLAFSTGEADAPPWDLRLVSDGSAGTPVALQRFAAAETNSVVRFSLPLRAMDLGEVPIEGVVGVALTYIGPQGPFQLRLADARVTIPEDRTSGFALATTSALDAGARPHETLLVAGDPGRGSTLAPVSFALRLLAALLTVFAVVGARGLARLAAGWPLAFVACVGAGPCLAALLEPLLGAALLPRIEHVPLALGVIALGLAALQREFFAKRIAATGEPAKLGAGEQARLSWVEALLGAAVLSIVAIHTCADPAGLPYPAFDPQLRLFPSLLRSLAAPLDYPIFLLVYLFLLAGSLKDGRSYRVVAGSCLRRLVLPYLFWTLAYLAVRHGKALAFGYHEAYRRELASGASWLGYLFQGSAQYHLHLLPLLFCLFMLYPLFRPALKRPWLAGLILVTMAIWPQLDELAYVHVASPMARDQVLWLTKIFANLGYGLLAFATYSLAQRALGARARQLLLGLAVVVGAASLALLFRFGLQVAEAGTWLTAPGATHLARYLGPAAVFLAFALARRRSWPRALVALGRMSLGIYLVHPLLLDILEILQRGLGLSPAATVLLNFLVVTLGSVLLVVLLRRLPGLAWTVCVQPVGAR